MLTLHQFEISPFCDKIRRLLTYKGHPFEVNEVSIMDTAKGTIKKVNPIGKLPTLEIDGTFICDSTNIAYALEERFPNPALIPTNSRERALVHILEDWADESLYFYEMHLRFTLPHNADKTLSSLLAQEPSLIKFLLPMAVPASMKRITKNQGVGKKPIQMICEDITRHVSSINELLTDGHWLVGDHLTLADIAVISQLNCIRQTREGGEIIEDYKPVLDWMQRVDDATLTALQSAA